MEIGPIGRLNLIKEQRAEGRPVDRVRIVPENTQRKTQRKTQPRLIGGWRTYGSGVELVGTPLNLFVVKIIMLSVQIVIFRYETVISL